MQSYIWSLVLYWTCFTVSEDLRPRVSGQRGNDALALAVNARRARAHQSAPPALSPSTRALNARRRRRRLCPRRRPLARARPRSARASESLAFRAPGHGFGQHPMQHPILQSHSFTQIQIASSPPTKHRNPFQIIFHWLPNHPPPQGGNRIWQIHVIDNCYFDRLSRKNEIRRPRPTVYGRSP